MAKDGGAEEQLTSGAHHSRFIMDNSHFDENTLQAFEFRQNLNTLPDMHSFDDDTHPSHPILPQNDVQVPLTKSMTSTTMPVSQGLHENVELELPASPVLVDEANRPPSDILLPSTPLIQRWQ